MGMRGACEGGNQGKTPLCNEILSGSLLERCPYLEGGMYRLQWSWDLKMCPY